MQQQLNRVMLGKSKVYTRNELNRNVDKKKEIIRDYHLGIK